MSLIFVIEKAHQLAFFQWGKKVEGTEDKDAFVYTLFKKCINKALCERAWLAKVLTRVGEEIQKRKIVTDNPFDAEKFFKSENK